MAGENKKQAPHAQHKGKNNAWKVARRIARLIEKCKIKFFWTFTFYMEVSNADKQKFWDKFRKNLRYYYPKSPFFRVIEEHKNGQWHYHVLFNVWMDWHIVQKLWEDSGAGKVILVKKLKSSGAVAHYIAKYISKGLDRGLHHIYSSSPEFCIHSSDFIKWIWKLIDLKVWTEVKNIFSYFDFAMYTKICGKQKRKRIRVLLQYVKWGYSW